MDLFRKHAGWIIVIILTSIAIIPLFHSGFFTMHDDEQIARLFDLHQALMSGNFPPRIAPNLGYGYGYPFFNFYPSFVYYVAEVFHLMGFGYIVSTKLMLAAGFMASAIGMYLLVKEFFSRAGGVVAAVAYTYLPYHAVDIYVRGAFAEFYAFVWLPFVFWSFLKLARTNKLIFVVPAALFFGFLILSHNLITLMSVPFIGIWLLYLMYITKQRRRFLMTALSALALGLGVTSYFWLPSYAEKNFTLINILTTELANYSIHFVCAHQLWNSPWGYGGSVGDCNDGLTFELGKVQIILSFVSIGLALYYILVKRAQKSAKTLVGILVFGALTLMSIFLMLQVSKPVWNLIQVFWYIQFPWRFLLIAGFCMAFLSGAALYFIHNTKTRIIVGAVLCVLLIGSTYSYFRPERFLAVEDNYYVSIPKIRWETSNLAYEYVPNGIATKKSKYGTTVIDITKPEVASKSYEIIQGDIEVLEIKNSPTQKKFTTKSSQGGVLQINSFAFPGWQVYIDEKKTSYQDQNKLRLIRVLIPPGQHTVTAKFTDTPVRSIGNFVSILSIIGVCMVAFFSLKKYGKKSKN